MDVINYFGKQVFNDTVMRQRLPKSVYQSLVKTSREGLKLDPSVAEVVAGAMKEWAIEQGATHYTHWFQPLTGITAGKHDAFINPTSDGRMVSEFSGKALVMSEPDASSFPSGGLRTTFEARGYTAWDPTSPAFVRDGTLFIPTAFCSYTGEALDEKTPLLRSMQAISKEAMRILHLFGNMTSKNVVPTVGAEQEYFLVDRDLYEQRLDLKLCGRTLFGAKSPKGQELDDHYCGRIKLRVAEYMKDLDKNLWGLGVTAKTKHNEAAPAQHELAPIYANANIACDHNQLTMELMRIIAKKHHMACLLHEKPFNYVNGSGKHNNWSLTTDDGIRLLEPGKTPWENVQFLTFLCAVITAVYRYGDLLRMSASCAGNDSRLGGFEAPPAVISIFLGDQLTSILKSIAQGDTPDTHATQTLQMGVATLPNLPMDDSDRNRTSPFAFTGNKFEFRMVGSSQSIAMANVVLNTSVADVLCEFADRLEKAADFDLEVKNIISDTMEKYSDIIFNGNNYSDEWIEEAKRRGLPILHSSVEAFNTLNDPKNIELFRRRNVFSEVECRSRYEIMMENYVKIVSIEAQTMLEMANRQLLPAVIKYAGQLAQSYNSLKEAGIEQTSVKTKLNKFAELIELISADTDTLTDALNTASDISDIPEHAKYLLDKIKPAMNSLRSHVDEAETIVDRSVWPVPTYTDLLHRM